MSSPERRIQSRAELAHGAAADFLKETARFAMKTANSLTKRGILALAMGIEEEDERVYADFAEAFRVVVRHGRALSSTPAWKRPPIATGCSPYTPSNSGTMRCIPRLSLSPTIRAHRSATCQLPNSGAMGSPAPSTLAALR